MKEDHSSTITDFTRKSGSGSFFTYMILLNCENGESGLQFMITSRDLNDIEKSKLSLLNTLSKSGFGHMECNTEKTYFPVYTTEKPVVTKVCSLFRK